MTNSAAAVEREHQSNSNGIENKIVEDEENSRPILFAGIFNVEIEMTGRHHGFG